MSWTWICARHSARVSAPSRRTDRWHDRLAARPPCRTASPHRRRGRHGRRGAGVVGLGAVAVLGDGARTLRSQVRHRPDVTTAEPAALGTVSSPATPTDGELEVRPGVICPTSTSSQSSTCFEPLLLSERARSSTCEGSAAVADDREAPDAPRHLLVPPTTPQQRLGQGFADYVADQVDGKRRHVGWPDTFQPNDRGLRSSRPQAPASLTAPTTRSSVPCFCPPGCHDGRRDRSSRVGRQEGELLRGVGG